VQLQKAMGRIGTAEVITLRFFEAAALTLLHVTNIACLDLQ